LDGSEALRDSGVDLLLVLVLLQHPFRSNTIRRVGGARPCACATVHYPFLVAAGALKPANCPSEKEAARLRPPTGIPIAGSYRRLEACQLLSEEEAAQLRPPISIQSLAAAGALKPANYPSDVEPGRC
jgi:hypothetical protein